MTSYVVSRPALALNTTVVDKLVDPQREREYILYEILYVVIIMRENCTEHGTKYPKGLKYFVGSVQGTHWVSY